ncbi:high light inducible protein [Candidatus Pacearchaeota archaeon]|nr:high light inducible protein [Candidatus Pacearchaeota archaeon]
MELYEKEVLVPLPRGGVDLLKYFSECVTAHLSDGEILLRFVVVKTDARGYHCELGVLANALDKGNERGSIFDFQMGGSEEVEDFTVALLIPTGIGAEIGGHCGDGNAVARLVASTCDTLITHPNVVNASDINELPENGLYVEGSVLTRLFMGQIGLQKVRSNRILMLMDRHSDRLFNDEVVNSVSAARATLGISCDVYEMEQQVESSSVYSGSGRCVGRVEKLQRLFDVIKKHKGSYDAIGLSTFITTPLTYHKDYFTSDGMINPWGGVEAMLTHSIAEVFQLPCAHSPLMPSKEVMNMEPGIVDPRKAPETSSMTYLHCILKGLHKSPRVVSSDRGLGVGRVSCLILPDGCLGIPTLAALKQGIQVIAVKDREHVMKNDLSSLPWRPGQFIQVDTYLEAVGVLQAIKAGISVESVKRPLSYTKVVEDLEVGL